MKKYFSCLGVNCLLVLSPVSAKDHSIYWKTIGEVLMIGGSVGSGGSTAWLVYELAKDNARVRDFFRGAQTKFRNLRQGSTPVYFISREIEFLGFGRVPGVQHAPGPRVVPTRNIVPPRGYLWGTGFRLAARFPGVFGFLAYSEPLHPAGQPVSRYSSPPEIVQ